MGARQGPGGRRVHRGAEPEHPQAASLFGTPRVSERTRTNGLRPRVPPPEVDLPATAAADPVAQAMHLPRFGRLMNELTPRRLMVCATLVACLGTANIAGAGTPTELLRVDV